MLHGYFSVQGLIVFVGMNKKCADMLIFTSIDDRVGDNLIVQ